MKRLLCFIGMIAVIITLFTACKVIDQTNSNQKVTAQYQNGEIITQVKMRGNEKIESTTFRYKINFLDQYINVAPWAAVYTFPNMEEAHVYQLPADLFAGKKDELEVEVAVTYQNGTEEILGNVRLHQMKKQVYDDFVIDPEFEEGSVFYRANGLTAVIEQDAYDTEILFYSNPSGKFPNIAVGFQKDYALYRLNSYQVISEAEALELDFEGFTAVDDFINVSEKDEMNMVIEYGMIDLEWAGFYPYDSKGNEVVYEGEVGEGGISLVKDGESVDMYTASLEKYKQIRSRIPHIRFLITSTNE